MGCFTHIFPCQAHSVPHLILKKSLFEDQTFTIALSSSRKAVFEDEMSFKDDSSTQKAVFVDEMLAGKYSAPSISLPSLIPTSPSSFRARPGIP